MATFINAPSSTFRDRTFRARTRRGAITLSHALIERCHPAPAKDDPGEVVNLTQAEIDASMDASLATLAPDSDLWVFGYGSLIWHPEMEAAEQRVATVQGWHRQFCLWQLRHRGTQKNPGLMLALDRGGSCVGVAFRLATPGVREKVARVWAREMGGNGYHPRWVRLHTANGVVDGVTFVVNHLGPRYAGQLSEADVTRYIASANGHRGAGAEYLRRLALTLEGAGIRDSRMWRLQRLVAAAMSARACR